MAFRADASAAIGTGHVMRCRALGQALEARGAQTVAPESKADWLVVDHYGLDELWEREQRRQAAKILAIDDLADRRHDCDVLLDQNYFPAAAGRYDPLVPARCRKLLGPRFALLRNEFAQQRKSLRKRSGEVHRILVTFGGIDAGNEASKAIALLKGRGYAVDVVVGAASPHADRVARDCAAAGFACHRQASNMAELMARADFAIGAGGSTTWERCCLGLPTLQVAIADNQVALTQSLAQAGIVTYAGTSLSGDPFEKALADADSLRKQSDLMMALVDGEGARRVAAAMFAAEDSEIFLRKATGQDARLYFDWAGDAAVRAQSFDSRPIAWPDHQAWFAARLADARLFVAQDQAGVPLGQVRFERKGAWRVNYSLAVEFRGLGLGGRMLAMAIAELRRGEPGAHLEAEVKTDNTASRKVFAALGFKPVSATLFRHGG